MRVFNKIFAGTFDDWFEVSWVEEVQRPSPLFTLERFSRFELCSKFPTFEYYEKKEHRNDLEGTIDGISIF